MVRPRLRSGRRGRPRPASARSPPWVAVVPGGVPRRRCALTVGVQRDARRVPAGSCGPRPAASVWAAPLFPTGVEEPVAVHVGLRRRRGLRRATPPCLDRRAGAVGAEHPPAARGGGRAVAGCAEQARPVRVVVARRRFPDANDRQPRTPPDALPSPPVQSGPWPGSGSPRGGPRHASPCSRRVGRPATGRHDVPGGRSSWPPRHQRGCARGRGRGRHGRLDSAPPAAGGLRTARPSRLGGGPGRPFHVKRSPNESGRRTAAPRNAREVRGHTASSARRCVPPRAGAVGVAASRAAPPDSPTAACQRALGRAAPPRGAERVATRSSVARLEARPPRPRALVLPHPARLRGTTRGRPARPRPGDPGLQRRGHGRFT